MYVAPLYHSLVIIYLFIYLFIHIYLFFLLFIRIPLSFLFLLSSFFKIFLANCFYLFNYPFFLPLFLFLFIGLAYCVSTAIQVFLLASKFNINI